MYTPLGLKNKMVILHATATTKVRIDCTRGALLTHMPPPANVDRRCKVSGLGRGHHMPPTPQKQQHVNKHNRALAPAEL